VALYAGNPIARGHVATDHCQVPPVYKTRLLKSSGFFLRQALRASTGQIPPQPRVFCSGRQQKARSTRNVTSEYLIF
jgi:hypothetical protein